jgi:poly(3-hydroxybutyrate) depolymerase
VASPFEDLLQRRKVVVDTLLDRAPGKLWQKGGGTDQVDLRREVHNGLVVLGGEPIAVAKRAEDSRGGREAGHVRFITTLGGAVRGAAAYDGAMAASPEVRVWTVRYRADNGLARSAYIALPADLGPRKNPALPLVISPHGRGLTGLANLRLWSDLPARGRFAVISPEGHGRVLPLHSWGWEGQISDLANMQYVAKATLPWLRVKLGAVYAIGGSMGGQETLLLVSRHPRLLAGAVSFDAPSSTRHTTPRACSAGSRS